MVGAHDGQFAPVRALIRNIHELLGVKRDLAPAAMTTIVVTHEMLIGTGRAGPEYSVEDPVQDSTGVQSAPMTGSSARETSSMRVPAGCLK